MMGMNVSARVVVFIQTEIPEESNYRRNLGWVSRVQAMDKAQESIMLAAMARFFSHVHVLDSDDGYVSLPKKSLLAA